MAPATQTQSQTSAIQSKYQQLGGPNGFLGWPIGWSAGQNAYDVKFQEGASNGGKCESFQNGRIFWHPSTDAHEVHGQILSTYYQFGSERWFVGYPTSDELPAGDGAGRMQTFQNATMYWSSGSGACEVHGMIRQKWLQLGGVKSSLRYPTSHEEATADGAGRVSHFQGGHIYYHFAVGARVVQGGILAAYSQFGGVRWFVGYPTTDELPADDAVGRVQQFQNASIYWSRASGAWEVHGAIRDKWLGLGGVRSFLGYPTSNETQAPGGGGRMNTFQHGNIYWSSGTGAWEVHGAILDAYRQAGTTQSALGYPTSDEQNWQGYRRSNFQHGYILWSAAKGTKICR